MLQEIVLGALGAARIPPVTCRFWGPFRSSPVVRSSPLRYTIHLPSEPRDTVPVPLPTRALPLTRRVPLHDRSTLLLYPVPLQK